MESTGGVSRKRLKWALIIMLMLFAALIVRLGYIMLIKGDEYEEKALSQQTKNTVLSATRGTIIDSTGVVLARNATAYKIVVWPNSIKKGERTRIATELSTLLDMDAANVLERISDTNKREIVLKRQVERETVDEITKLKLGKGIGTAIDTKRYYANGTLYSQLLGFCTIDGIGQAGLEQKYNDYLAGEDGEMVTETDARGNPLAYGVQEYISATDGYNMTLTTNAVIQSALEKACQEALEVNKAMSAQGIIMNCNTGEIVALTTQPDYDPNDPPRDDMATLNALMRNRVVTDAYEPGSTFKLVTLAAALDSSTVTDDTTFSCPGYIYVGSDRIRCWKTAGHGTQLLKNAVENSCNAAFVRMALEMGTETFYDYIYALGFGSSTGSGIPGESGGIVTHEKYVNDSLLARIGFGQSIAVTPIQLVNAVSAIVNGGTLMQPYVVDSVTAADGTVILDNTPTVIRRVISEATSAKVREIAEAVVTEGSGKNAAIPGYRVGGKTGTAQKYDETGVAEGKLIASFIGFAPANDPEFVCLILVDEPTVGTIFGSTVAAPFVKQALEETLRYAGYMPEGGETAVVTPSVIGMTVAEAKRALEETGLRATYQSGEEQIVTAQVPIEGEWVANGSGVLLYTDDMAEDAALTDSETELVKIPDVTGMKKLEAHDTLKAKGLTILIDPPDQTGRAIRQYPEAGTMAPEGTSVLVEFSDTDIGD